MELSLRGALPFDFAQGMLCDDRAASLQGSRHKIASPSKERLARNDR
jgi:hypothetical protein